VESGQDANPKTSEAADATSCLTEEESTEQRKRPTDEGLELIGEPEGSKKQ
jgi:hypothetical protein